MKAYLILLPLFLLALLQGSILSLNLILFLLLVWAAIRPPKETFLIAFLSGLFLDLVKGTWLGFSSLALLIATGLFILYSRRFDSLHPLFLAVFIFAVSFLWNLISQEPWLIEGLVLVGLSLLARPITKYYQEGISREKLRLKL